jgi:hypothetical protein
MSAARKGKLKERHHWWPECLSAHWCGADGLINVIGADGREFRSPPANVGVIGNGHIIKLGKGKPSPWDESFEHAFDAADSALPRIVAWLETLERQWVERPPRRTERFLTQPVTDAQFGELVESLVSLAVRSPKFRAAAVAPAIHLRGPLEPDERHVLEAMNMRHCQRMIADACKRGGKLVALYAKEGEFIFGDGFYNTATGVSTPPISPRMLVPLTPQIAVLYSRPMAFGVEPRLTTLVVDAAEVDAFNIVVQAYAKDWLFYRRIRPEINEHFRIREHRIFTDHNNPVDQIARDIPGVRNSGLFGF